MESLKMSEVFDLPVSVDGFNLNDGHLGAEGDTTIANFDYEFVSDLSESMAHHAAHAINNHDRLAEENAELREAFKELKSITMQEREWRLEDSEVGLCEAQESLNTLSYRIDKLLNK